MSNSKGFDSLFLGPLVGADVGAVEAFELGGDFAGVPGLDEGVAGRDPGILDIFLSTQPIYVVYGSFVGHELGK